MLIAVASTIMFKRSTIITGLLWQVMSVGESTDGRLGRPTAESDVYCLAEVVQGLEDKELIGVATGVPAVYC